MLLTITEIQKIVNESVDDDDTIDIRVHKLADKLAILLVELGYPAGTDITDYVSQYILAKMKELKKPFRKPYDKVAAAAKAKETKAKRAAYFKSLVKDQPNQHHEDRYVPGPGRKEVTFKNLYVRSAEDPEYETVYLKVGDAIVQDKTKPWSGPTLVTTKYADELVTLDNNWVILARRD